MAERISARGYTSVILVLNMKRFIHPQDQERFETIRGGSEFAKVLREIWPTACQKQDFFIPLEEERRLRAEKEGRRFSDDEKMSTEQVGFATGIYRAMIVERYAWPTYALDKALVEFPPELRSNFQFKKLFLRAWERWEVYIRPSFSGFFVIRLTQHYHKKPRLLLTLAQDVLDLQESLDVHSARQWLERKRHEFKNDPEELAKRERSIQALLQWMGAEEEGGDLLYYPVQWKIAMEVAGLFVQKIGTHIPLSNGQPPIRLIKPDERLSIPLHDSYVIHHLDTLLAHPSLIKGHDKRTVTAGVQVPISLNDIRHKEAHRLRQELANLCEGSVLKPRQSRVKDDKIDPAAEEQRSKTSSRENIFFPKPRWSIVDHILEENQATWNDELCLLFSRTAVIMPSPNWQDSDLAVSTVPSATLHARYPRYWEAIEHMIEFVVEVHVLGQLLESLTFDLLEDIAQVVHETRAKLFSGDIKMHPRLPDLVARATQLRRLAAICQSLSHPQFWSRAEYAIKKAEYLFGQLGVPRTLEHLERNISSINSVVDHIDELYLADLSEKNNDKTTLLSIGLAAASLTLTLLMLPSFWIDLLQFAQADRGGLRGFVLGFWVLGTFVALVLILLAGYLLTMTIRQKQRLIELIRKFMRGV